MDKVKLHYALRAAATAVSTVASGISAVITIRSVLTDDLPAEEAKARMAVGGGLAALSALSAASTVSNIRKARTGKGTTIVIDNSKPATV